jgi:acyl-CoA reductase-like NAD-dependent aldehyde dehydrogenase
MRVLQRLRQAIRQQRYRISSHANEEMSEDNLEANDVERIILTGNIARRFSRDPRGTRYEVIGESTDGRSAAVVCRFLPSGVLLIITAYEVEA